MSSDVTCEKLREIGAELALGVLPGRERAEAVAHLDRCADCREYVEHLTFAGDRLIGLLPCSEPPVGFESRVARSLGQEAMAHERRLYAGGPGLAHKGFRSRARSARLRAASVVAALGLAVGFGGWAIGTAIENVTASTSPAVEAATGLLVGELTSARGHGQPAGEIYAHPGDPGWIYASVDLAASGTPYSGKVSCLLERSDGSTVRVGSFALHEGRGDWGAPAPVNPSALSGASLTSSDGTVLATAHFRTDRQA
ncbi:zf-HC2 domain-containing protein [Streptomyces sp. NPDC005202]|uniref:zf-HC2 domain-containing protein n=1 Tax=Streptomyces sp. NPDC005202 TaxID=3157021 RepID=UPI0033A9F792